MTDSLLASIARGAAPHLTSVSFLSAVLGYVLIMYRTLIILVATITLGLASVAGADDGHRQHDVDHKMARAALARGEILSLETILKLVRPRFEDAIVGIKFERHGDVWFYEFRTVDQAGHLHYRHANAKTGVLETLENHP